MGQVKHRCHFSPRWDLIDISGFPISLAVIQEHILPLIAPGREMLNCPGIAISPAMGHDPDDGSQAQGGRMPYNLELEKKIDAFAAAGPEKKKMFGGIGYLFQGNMGFGIYRDHLVLRVGAEEAARLLREKGARPFDISGRAMKGWLMIGEEGWRHDGKLAAWLALARAHASGLPPKT
jgi:TfoX/Sxy family transcriptional regulator of competence genes